VRSTPDPDATTDMDWALYLFRHANQRGVIEEWWRHVPSNHFFLAQRDTGTNEILRTYNLPASGKASV
jgi:sarcosine oxidase subunit delta